MDPKEHLCVRFVPLFNHLKIEDQRRINSLVHRTTYQKGETVFSPKDEPQLVIVARGSLKVYQLSVNGKEQLLRIVEPGSYEGENFLFGVENQHLFAEALEETRVCALKQDDFQGLLLDYPQLSLKFLTINAQKNTQMQEQTQFLTMEKVEERLAAYLLDLYKASQHKQVKIPMKLKELAAFLGTTPETVSRKLKYLQELGLIRRNKKEIEILDLAALESL